MATTSSIVEDLDFVRTLGRGAYGEVRLAVSSKSQCKMAVKMMDLRKYPDAAKDIQREVLCHQCVDHEHIIRFYGERTVDNTKYIFLEYASGGELVERVGPTGMPPRVARKYFKQLLRGVDYLHKKGIVHRDIKPENLLLDGNDNLKICDFGYATVYRLKGKDYLLKTHPGTPRYAAPELLKKEDYRATPVDIWSCGVVLVFFLTGEHPWEFPTRACKEYRRWTECQIALQPLCRIDILALSLLRRILVENPVERAGLESIIQHPWYTKYANSQSPPEAPEGRSPSCLFQPPEPDREQQGETPGSPPEDKTDESAC